MTLLNGAAVLANFFRRRDRREVSAHARERDVCTPQGFQMIARHFSAGPPFVFVTVENQSLPMWAAPASHMCAHTCTTRSSRWRVVSKPSRCSDAAGDL